MALVIAEVGENHCGDWQMARALVDAAAHAHADYVKFQLYEADDVADDDPERDWFRRVQVPVSELADLVAYCRRAGIAPLCTPWDAAKAATVLDLGMADVKIASFHITDTAMLRLVNQRARRVFLSTGMANWDEIDAAVACLDRVELYLLHCVSEYPLPDEHVNLAVMDGLRERYGARARIGYSDHTIGILAPIAAVARGADVVEKHITMSRAREGTDHVLSAEPAELIEMVSHIRAIQRMIGDGVKTLTPGEVANQSFLRNRFRHGKGPRSRRNVTAV